MTRKSKTAELAGSTVSDAAWQGGQYQPTDMDMTMTTNITARPDRAMFLENSPYEADGGHSIGKDPRQIPVAELRRFSFPESPIKAVRAKCIDCSGGSMAEARKCACTGCPLWPMRMGVNPFHASSVSAKAATEAVEA